jgi:hemolysin III
MESAHGIEGTAASHHPARSNVSRAIYGLMTVLAVLQVVMEHPDSPWASAVSLFGATLAVALVDAYSESIGAMLVRRRSLDWQEFREVVRQVAPVMIGAQAPTIVVLLSVAGLIEHESALRLAEVVTFVFLFGYGFAVGRMLGGSLARQLASGIALLAIGALIVGIKAALH